jgi:hypothetical protein
MLPEWQPLPRLDRLLSISLAVVLIIAAKIEVLTLTTVAGTGSTQLERVLHFRSSLPVEPA